MNIDQQLDVRGLSCPLPILRAKRVLDGLDSGAVLQVIATDPGAVKDFESFAEQTGNALLDSVQTGDQYRIRLRKK